MNQEITPKIAEILDKYDKVLETIVAELTEAGFNSACHFISPRNPAIRVGFVHEGSEGCSDEASDPLRISSKCLRVIKGYYDTSITAEEAIHDVGMLLAGELDRIDRELKIYKHVFLKDQMIEDGEL